MLIMSFDFMDFLKGKLENIEQLDLEKVQAIATKTSQYLQGLGEVMQGDDEGEKEEAIQNAMELQKYLQEKMVTVAQQAGVNKEQLLELADNPAFSEAEKKAIMDLSENLSIDNDNNSTNKIEATAR